MKARSLMAAFNEAAREGPRIYFAPLIGAIRAIKEELRPHPPPVSGDQQRPSENKDAKTSA